LAAANASEGPAAWLSAHRLACVDQTRLQRTISGHRVAREHHLPRTRETDQTREPLGSTRAGDDAQTYLGQPELRVLPGDPEIAGERHLEAAAEREPLDRGDRDLRDRLEVAAGLLERADVLRDLVRPVVDHRLDVGAGREDLLAPPDHDGPNGFVPRHGRGGLGELARDGAGECVRGRLVDADRRDPAVDVDADELPHGRPILADRRARDRSEGIRCTCNSLLQSPT
jgi:hypothetical protein